LIYRIVHSQGIAEDLLQEVFVKIWSNISSYDSAKAKLVTWMANIARNLAIDKIRSKDYKNALENRDIWDFVNIIEAPGINTDQIGVKEMLNSLTDEQRKLIDIIYFEGYTQADAAKELGIPLGTVKTRLRAAILKLREIYT
jgi:RNA polymerase sigma-70 factor (ECF subfamily)